MALFNVLLKILILRLESLLRLVGTGTVYFNYGRHDSLFEIVPSDIEFTFRAVYFLKTPDRDA